MPKAAIGSFLALCLLTAAGCSGSGRPHPVACISKELRHQKLHLVMQHTRELDRQHVLINSLSPTGCHLVIGLGRRTKPGSIKIIDDLIGPEGVKYQLHTSRIVAA